MTNTSLPRMLARLRGTRLVVAAVVFLAIIIAIARGLTGAYIEVLWQAEVGYTRAFWTRVLWEWGVRIAAGLAVGVLVFVNLRVASLTLGGIQIRRRFGNLEISEQLPRQYVSWAMLGAATLLGLWFGASLPPSVGQRVLLLLNAEAWGLSEPVLGHDVGFYVFWVPVLGSAFVYALTTVFLVFTLATAGYAATGALSWGRGGIQAQPLARLHLGLLLGVFFVLVAGRLWLGRYLLLLDGNSAVQGIFGYADAEARLPALQTLTVIAVGAGAAAAWGAWKGRGVPVIGSIVAVLVGAILIGELYPGLVQSFRVEPNELEREAPYIEDNLRFTRVGFGLHPEVLERRAFTYRPGETIDWVQAERQFAGIPMWSRASLLATFLEQQANYEYYDFGDVTIDRYRGPTGPVPVVIAAREIDPAGILDPNWQNLHLRELYIAGMGAVASLASARTPEGGPQMLLSGIPPLQVPGAPELAGLRLTRPEIFFGTRLQRPYAVVTPGEGQYLAPDGSAGTAGVDYPVGVPLTSGLRTLLFAWRFRDANLLFASEVTGESRVIFRRLAVERAAAVAPFLRFPESPYPVVSDGRIVWVLEAFTASGYFPLSAAAEFGSIRPRVTYVRNSFKVTVDAVSGAVDLYRVPVADPIADAYERAFPGLFKPISEMPAEVREHIRYSRVLMDLQADVLLQYHQEAAAAFHGQQDVWAEPQELAEGTAPGPYRPEYGLYRLPGEEQARFQLSTAFVPVGRQNLTAMFVARTDASGVPELVLIDVPVEEQAPGPRQIEVLVEQDPLISQQFSLWRTGGSEVWTGHLHLVPVGNRFLYVEPVFLVASENAIPLLQRVVVSDGQRVAMTETLDEAIAQLGGGRRAPTADGADGATLPLGTTAWPADALELLEQAESRARAGDWQGFGEALDRLRTLLQRLTEGQLRGSGE